MNLLKKGLLIFTAGVVFVALSACFITLSLSPLDVSTWDEVCRALTSGWLLISFMLAWVWV